MESVKRMPIVQQVVDKLKEYLFSGEIAVGDKLPVEKSSVSSWVWEEAPCGRRSAYWKPPVMWS